jgi:hypothetical protein
MQPEGPGKAIADGSSKCINCRIAICCRDLVSQRCQIDPGQKDLQPGGENSLHQAYCGEKIIFAVICGMHSGEVEHLYI